MMILDAVTIPTPPLSVIEDVGMAAGIILLVMIPFVLAGYVISQEVRTDVRELVTDVARDILDGVKEWFGPVWRAIVLYSVLHYVIEMEHSNALEVAALLALADVAAHPKTRPRRTVRDVTKIVKRGRTATYERTHEEQK